MLYPHKYFAVKNDALPDSLTPVVEFRLPITLTSTPPSAYAPYRRAIPNPALSYKWERRAIIVAIHFVNILQISSRYISRTNGYARVLLKVVLLLLLRLTKR